MIRSIAFWVSATAFFCHAFLAMAFVCQRQVAWREIALAFGQLVFCWATADRRRR